MRWTAAAVLTLALAAPGGAAPPLHGVFAAGRSLAGVRLGMTPAAVKARWGRNFGVCRSCNDRTWYFNYRPFTSQGAGVTFRRGRVVAVFTLSSPVGWRTNKGLVLGDDTARITSLYGPLFRQECGMYSAFAQRAGSAVTAFYVAEDRLWGFGLSRPDIPLCR